MIKVSNISRRPQVFNLPHDVMCASSCSCATHEHRQTDRDPKTGEVGVRVLERKLSGSAHVLPGTFVMLPDEAERAPEIVRAVARGESTVTKVEAPKAVAKN